MPLHLLPLQHRRLAPRAGPDEGDELGKLDVVGLLVPLREAPHRRWHEVAVHRGQLYAAGHLVARGQHALGAKGLYALVVPVGRIPAGVGHGDEPAGVLCQHGHRVKIVHLLDLVTVAMAHRGDGLGRLPAGEPVLHVKVVDKHVLEDAPAGAEVFHGRHRIVAAARLDNLQVPDGALVKLLLHLSEVAVAPPLVAAYKRQLRLRGQVHGLLHLRDLMGDGLLREDSLPCLQRRHDEWEVRVRGGGDDDDLHLGVRQRLLDAPRPPATMVLCYVLRLPHIDVHNPLDL
mmetsp:Transcript_5886/g.15696  ORF Transcript_5886/g.15696 Transcript_5886/m.15696 type:complete len:288 (+) Transcript_5886:192-1055(+)